MDIMNIPINIKGNPILIANVSSDKRRSQKFTCQPIGACRDYVSGTYDVGGI